VLVFAMRSLSPAGHASVFVLIRSLGLN